MNNGYENTKYDYLFDYDLIYIGVVIYKNNQAGLLACNLGTKEVKRYVSLQACEKNYTFVPLIRDECNLLADAGLRVISYAWILSLLFQVSKENYPEAFTRIHQFNYLQLLDVKKSDPEKKVLSNNSIVRITSGIESVVDECMKRNLVSVLLREMYFQDVLREIHSTGFMIDISACKEIYKSYKQSITNLPKVVHVDVDRERLRLNKKIKSTPSLVFDTNAKGDYPINSHFGISLSTMRVYTSKENVQGYSKEYRRCFRPVEREMLVSYDIASCQPFILANIANQTDLIAKYEAGEDLYEIFALAANIPMMEKRREISKKLFIQIIFGASSETIAKEISDLGWNCNASEAYEIKRSMLRSYPQIDRFISNSYEYSAFMLRSNRYVWQTKETNILPIILQSIEADILRDIMIQLDDVLSINSLGRLYMPIHDAIIIEANTCDLEQLRDVVKEAFIEAYNQYFKIRNIQIQEEIIK